MGNINSKLIRHSKARLIVSGDVIEEYRYERDYFYNWGPEKKSGGERGIVHVEKRGDHLERARRSIRRVIECNTSKERLPIFITYTFKKNIKSLKEANPLFSKHVKELQRRYGKVKYLCVPEFQRRGAVHYHVIYFDLPYIKNVKKVMEKLWPYGFSQVKAIRKIRSIGAYVSKYLQKGVADERRKRGEKGYFTSRGLKRPVEIRDEEHVDSELQDIESRNRMEKEFESSYDSPRGRVVYKRYKLSDYVERKSRVPKGKGKQLHRA